MAKRPNGKLRIFQEIALAYEKDYRANFKKNFEYAFRLTNQKVEPASDEIRNAFDHFASATFNAEKISQTRKPSEKQELLNEGLRDVARGRRHIAAGDFHSVKFSTNRRVKIVAELIEEMEAKDRVDMNNERETLYGLSREAREIPDPPADRYNKIEDVIAATNLTFDLIARLKDVADRLDELYRTIIVDAGDRHPAIMAHIAYIQSISFAPTPE
jgi:hypothetical protein